MEDVLTESEFQGKKPTLFSKLSFACALLVLLTFTALCVKAIVSPGDDESHELLWILIILTFMASTILGVLFSILSLVKKERLRFFKLAAIIINSSIFVLAAVSIIYAMLYSAKKG